MSLASGSRNRRESELVYRTEPGHRQAERDDQVRAWLARVGAPLGSAAAEGPVPALEEVVAEALSLSHRHATVTRMAVVHCLTTDVP